MTQKAIHGCLGMAGQGDNRPGNVRWKLQKGIRKPFKVVYTYIISIVVVVSQVYMYVKT